MQTQLREQQAELTLLKAGGDVIEDEAEGRFETTAGDTEALNKCGAATKFYRIWESAMGTDETKIKAECKDEISDSTQGFSHNRFIAPCSAPADWCS